MKVYIAGPMSRLPQFNFPYFDGVAKLLREHGYTVVSPAELDDDEFRARVMAHNITGFETDLLGAWADCLSRDVKLITDDGIEGIVLLHGWEKSRGAKLEAYVGLLNDLKFALFDRREIGLVQPVSRQYVLDMIGKNT